MSAADGNVLRSRAASEPRLTRTPPDADTNLVSAVPTTAARNAARPFTVSRVARAAAGAACALRRSPPPTTPGSRSDTRRRPSSTTSSSTAKLSQSIAAGHGLSIRGEPFFFPAPLAPLVQSPAWLLELDDRRLHRGQDPQRGRDVGRGLPRVLACRAASSGRPSRCSPPPRQSRRRRCSTTRYLMSEALAYPVFLARGRRPRERARRALTPDGDRGAGCLPRSRSRHASSSSSSRSSTSPAVALCGRGNYRRHALPCSAAARCSSAPPRHPGSARPYGGATHLRPSLGAACALGARERHALAVRDSAWRSSRARSFGLGFMLGRPRSQIERAVAALTVVSPAALHRPGGADRRPAEAHRPLERYLFYCHPARASSRSSPMWNAARRGGSCTSRCGLIGALALSRFRCRTDGNDGVLLRRASR